MSHFMKNCYRYSSTPVVAPAPNPNDFEVLKCEPGGWYFVAGLRYPSCTNFEGKKVLILRSDPRKVVELDPHFEQGGEVAARFEPTAFGWNLAIKTARILAGRN